MFQKKINIKHIIKNKDLTVEYEQTNPTIFRKKIKDNYKIIPMNNTKQYLGSNRHYPVATKEWNNSIYSYNNNSLKNITTANKSLTDLLQIYFNLYFSKDLLGNKYIPAKDKSLFFSKIYVGKPELKHTNDKVIIDLNVYNQEKLDIMSKMDIIVYMLFSKHKNT